MPIFTVFGTLPAFLALFLILNRTVFQLKRYLLATVAFTLGIYEKKTYTLHLKQRAMKSGAVHSTEDIIILM